MPPTPTDLLKRLDFQFPWIIETKSDFSSPSSGSQVILAIVGSPFPILVSAKKLESGVCMPNEEASQGRVLA